MACMSHILRNYEPLAGQNFMPFELAHYRQKLRHSTSRGRLRHFRLAALETPLPATIPDNEILDYRRAHQFLTFSSSTTERGCSG